MGAVPQQWPAPDGLIRWKPLEGATAYEVLYVDIHPSKSFQTTTDVADERKFFTFHSQLGYTTASTQDRRCTTSTASPTTTA